MNISLEVRAGFPAFTQRFEGYIHEMYLDVKGLVTCAVGDLIDPLRYALTLPWLKVGAERASGHEITLEWLRVKRMKPGQEAHLYHTPISLYLTKESIDKLVLAHLDVDAEMLATHFFPGLSSFPPEVQTAICSMAWAMGAGFPVKYPKFTAAILRRDWKTAADECAISDARNKGVDARNDANKDLFLQWVPS